MPLELLSSIKGAKPSYALEELFLKVKTAVNEIEEELRCDDNFKIIDFETLRDDEVVKSDEEEIELIKQNFPLQKDGYLVVPKVIEE